MQMQCNWHFYVFMILTACWQVAPANAQLVQKSAYEAVVQEGNGASTTFWYDQGKYSIQFADTILLCDDALPPARWYVNLKYKTADLSSVFVIVQLVALIKKDGVDAICRRTQMDRSLLVRFARRYQSYVPRNLDHTLQMVNTSAPGFLAAFELIGRGSVAGLRCDLYHSKAASDHTLSVEPSSGFVLKESYLRASGNPRIPPVRSEAAVVRFRLLPSVEASHFQVPTGFTVMLPRLFADIALPTGVKRQLKTGDSAMLGFDLKKLLEDDEQWEQRINRAHKAKK